MFEPTPRARAVAILSFAAVILLLGRTAVALTPSGADVAVWWPASGVAIAVVAKCRRDRAWFLVALFVATLLANLTGGKSLGISTGFGLSNTAEAWVAAAIIGRGRDAVIDGLGDVVRFVVGVVAGVSVIGVGAVITLDTFATIDPVGVFMAVVPSHATGVFLIAPFALSRRTRVRRRLVERVLIWSCVAATATLTFASGDHGQYAFLLVPFLLWSVVRLGVRAGTAQLLVVGVGATVLTTWARTDLFEADGWMISLQLFIVTCAVLVITVGASTADRERALQRLRASESIYRAGFAEAVVAMMLVRISGGVLRVVEANGPARSSLGVTIDTGCSDLLIDEAGTPLADIVDRLVPGEGLRLEMTDAIGMRWFSVSMSRLSGADDDAVVSLQIVETTDRRDAERRLRATAVVDQLTGLPNMTALRSTLPGDIARAEQNRAFVAVVAIDIRGFAAVNEVFGHTIGDQVLVAFADRLRAVAGDGRQVARVGGDRFVLVIPSVASEDEAVRVAQRIFEATELPIHLRALDYEVNLSLGLALSGGGIEADQLLSEADLAVNSAKQGEARRVAVYSATLRDGAAKRLQTLDEVRLALTRREFEMFMQPVTELPTGRVIAAEALIRWRTESGTLRSPVEWLPLVEQSGLMREIGAWILDESIRQAAEWLEIVGPAEAPAVHVNVSGSQFENDGFAELVISTLDRHGYPPELLVLELTETFLARTDDTLRKEFAQLANRGVKLAADDFGTGYSPLARIVELPIHMIKIDRLFVKDLGRNARSGAVVSALVQMSSELGIDVVAEGIETDEQRRILESLGCRAGQGFLWSPAVDARSFQDQVLAPIAMAQVEASIDG